jgi:hypothetical protein
MMRAMVPCAYLRVFRPLEALPSGERERWERFIVGGGAPSLGLRRYREVPPGPRTPYPFLESMEEDHADVRREDGTLFVCPRRSHLQALASMVAPRETSTEETAEPLVSDVDARRAARELARLRRQDPSLVPSMLQSAWHVPVRWFVLFDDAERRLQELPSGEWVIRYWAPIDAAARRAAHAAAILRRADMDPVARLVRDLHEWLANFDRRSAVELDYGEVAGMFTWDELDDDHSVAGVSEIVEALSGAEGPETAAELYRSIAARWAETRSRETLN